MWRDGWDDWLPAKSVFFKRPSTNPPEIPSSNSDMPSENAADSIRSQKPKRSAMDASAATARYNRHRSNSNTMGILVISFLAIIAIVLVIFLVVAIQWNAAEAAQ